MTSVPFFQLDSPLRLSINDVFNLLRYSQHIIVRLYWGNKSTLTHLSGSFLSKNRLSYPQFIEVVALRSLSTLLINSGKYKGT